MYIACIVHACICYMNLCTWIVLLNLLNNYIIKLFLFWYFTYRFMYCILYFLSPGGALHIHDSALVDIHWLIRRATYDPNCYMCTDDHAQLHFKFFPKPPGNYSGSSYMLLSWFNIFFNVLFVWFHALLEMYWPYYCRYKCRSSMG